MRVMLVVPRAEQKLLQFLRTKFAGDAEILIVEDRRTGQRRKKPAMRNQERRRQDRRGAQRDRVGTFLILRDPAGV